ncbi:hypothetical protein A33Q_0168 [Indibacter alkaliphilus LW1]|uniref:Spi protease inhibitor domain-containing protein n=1 Tax=Indibacter alkaliphilus (strain CCUG 57479 / KCTC 22604 / LW1) TaxID=1189612 RepID=S2E6P4_INDAL|nr:Spi family protease inhibitor [Indibacter alkaliphilus]EPA00297.1 hypothetical protein A33Q_0168 [Indibacter alkaliphilus LW1]
MEISEIIQEHIEEDLKDFSISEDLAMKTAVSFFSTDSSVISARIAPSSVKIKELEKVKLDDSKSYEVYLVNDQDGFMILSGDSRVMPVLAFSPTGSISKEDLNEVNGLKVWFANTMEQIEEELKGVESVHPIVYGEWKKYTQDFDPMGRIWEDAGNIASNTNCYEWYEYGQFMCSPYFTLNQNGPLYSNQISWGQSGISNYFAPGLWNCECGRSPIGCGAVAIAQTVWHYRRNQTFYSSMPQFSNTTCTPSTQGQQNLAHFMLQAAVLAKTKFNWFGCNGMTYPWEIRPALSLLGMQSNGSISTFNPALLRNEISQGYPAIFYGRDNLLQWHIWTSDGYRTHNYKSYNCDTDSCVEWHFSYFYMNWGWNGQNTTNPNIINNPNYDSHNGFFGSGVFQPNGSNTSYNNDLKMITGIR